MPKDKKIKINWKRIGTIGVTIIITILIFTFFDYLIHTLKAEYAVPSYYFRNKIIFGILWGWVLYALFIWRIKRMWLKSLLFSAIIAIFLQVRYAIEGYSLDFVIEFLFIHFGILWIVSYFAFKTIRKK